jgi:hypothetical protein
VDDAGGGATRHQPAIRVVHVIGKAINTTDEDSEF